jgi:hypothetical protein
VEAMGRLKFMFIPLPPHSACSLCLPHLLAPSCSACGPLGATPLLSLMW